MPQILCINKIKEKIEDESEKASELKIRIAYK